MLISTTSMNSQFNHKKHGPTVITADKFSSVNTTIGISHKPTSIHQLSKAELPSSNDIGRERFSSTCSRAVIDSHTDRRTAGTLALNSFVQDHSFQLSNRARLLSENKYKIAQRSSTPFKIEFTPYKIPPNLGDHPPANQDTSLSYDVPEARHFEIKVLKSDKSDLSGSPPIKPLPTIRKDRRQIPKVRK